MASVRTPDRRRPSITSQRRSRWSQKLRSQCSAIWANLHRDHLWRRIVKFSIATTVALIVVVLPDAVALFGTTAFFALLTTVFAHPAQRMGLMVESLLLIFAGCILGTAWAIFGVWLSSLVLASNVSGAYAIRAVFLLCAVFQHGYLRSSSPRLIAYVLFHLLTSTAILLGPARAVTTSIITGIAYPVLIGSAATLLANLLVFPELSYTYLAQIAINTISETTLTLSRSTRWFLAPGDPCLGPSEGLGEESLTQNTLYQNPSRKRVDENARTGEYRWYRKPLALRNPFHAPGSTPALVTVPKGVTSLATLTDSKSILRSKLQRCKSGQSEINLEVSFGPLSPLSMKPITGKLMTGLVHNTITLIGSCENKFVMLRRNTDLRRDEASRSRGSSRSSRRSSSSSRSSRRSSSSSSSSSDNSRSSSDSTEDDDSEISIDTATATATATELVDPLLEVEMGNVEVFEAMISRIREPSTELVETIRRSAMVVTTALAYCYGLPKLHFGMPTPKRIPLEEMDIHIDAFLDALARFDRSSMAELERPAELEGSEMNLMPRMETFLVSSFLLGLRQSAVRLLQMLHYARELVEQRQRVRFWTQIHIPRLSGWRQWLSTGGEYDAMVLPQSMRRGARSPRGSLREKRETERRDAGLPSEAGRKKASPSAPNDEEKLAGGGSRDDGHPDAQAAERPVSSREKQAKRKRQRQRHASPQEGLRGALRHARMAAADMYESMQKSDDALYAMKLVVAFFLVSWPGLVPSWHDWYIEVRGVWAPLQLILVFEVAIGTSLFVFLLRMVGIAFGCLVGLLAWEIGRGHKVPLVIIMVLGIIPSIYVQIGTKYVKAGMVAINSIASVSLTMVFVNGRSVEIFWRRLVTFLIGCLVGLLVSLMLYPTRARHRLAESLSASITHITTMQTAVAVGVDKARAPDIRNQKLLRRFERARGKAQGALAAAETFLPFCLTEPRLKGSFRHLHPIYREMIYVLHHIVNRMDSMVQLRRVYGSSVLEELNPHVHAYRRALAASVTMALFSVNQALVTRMPLPQFIPSARLAMWRLVRRVREVLQLKAAEHGLAGDTTVGEGLTRYIERVRSEAGKRGALDERSARLVTHYKFLSWNANASGQMEIVEYLEELVELAKLLVGVNAFRSGMLERPTFHDYASLASGEMDEQKKRRKRRRKKKKRKKREEEEEEEEEQGNGPDGEGRRGEDWEDDNREVVVDDELARAEQGAVLGAAAAAIPLQEIDTGTSTGRQQSSRGGLGRIEGRLRRIATRDKKAQEWEHAVEGAEEESHPEVPISLQRVSSRRSARRASAGVRRRAQTLQDGDEGGRDAVGGLKGKGIDEEDDEAGH
ncbi:hypothetical protein SODALDRAFT_272691 [Sodiomyces alkalinus F11]|uniref:Integral membrane bound transporter domain-containing protein n=1 Tax=Sodiomyces alkalinus (strain CBS 110278 / VKM F-3762 / F11) TaxID=1314773 RepID=A0A3N2Q1T8_SODAK|nr:hypothetical protein SODALDRAFT_272691 [Sodiomyces alkalinus F11]ROT40724.1 hypothetical protein SODALDRAFT_272691 [Sodiomyces alkalinus F11]